MRAAVLGEAAALRWMIEAGADLDATSRPSDTQDGGHTALMLAASEGNLGAAQVLLEAGADPEIEDVTGRRALDWARLGGSRELIQRFEELARPSTEAPEEIEPAPAPAPENPSRPPLTSTKTHWRGIANPEADDITVWILASPETTASALVERFRAQTWIPDAYHRPCHAEGRSFLVFRLVGHPWTVVRDAHPFEQSPLSLGEPDAAALATQLDTEALFLDHRVSRGSLRLSRFRGPTIVERFAYSWPGEIYSEHDDSRDWEPDAFDDEDDRWIHEGSESSPPIVCDDPETFLHHRLRQLEAFAPSWQREAGRNHRLEIAGWSAEDFERIDFIALGPPQLSPSSAN